MDHYRSNIFFLTQVSRFIDTCQIIIVVFFPRSSASLEELGLKTLSRLRVFEFHTGYFTQWMNIFLLSFHRLTSTYQMLKLPKDLSFNTYSSQCHSNNCTVLLQIFIVYYIINIRYQTFDSIYLSFVFLSCPIIIINISQNKILFKLNKEIKGK